MTSSIASPERLEDEARRAGLRVLGQRTVDSGPTEARFEWWCSGAMSPIDPQLELRLLALYPEQMNIYADRGNIRSAAALRVARDRLPLRGLGPRGGFDPGAT